MVQKMSPERRGGGGGGGGGGGWGGGGGGGGGGGYVTPLDPPLTVVFILQKVNNVTSRLLSTTYRILQVTSFHYNAFILEKISKLAFIKKNICLGSAISMQIDFILL